MNVQAFVNELVVQRDMALARCAELASQLADVQEKIKELEAPKDLSSSEERKNVKPLRSEKA